MTVEITTPRSRRAILAAALGAGAATVAAALGRPLAVRATDGQPVLVGHTYTATTMTEFDATGAYAALAGTSDNSDIGVSGGSDMGSGVEGDSNSGYGVYGQSSAGVGVVGNSFASNQPAILGASLGDNTGVFGFSGSVSSVTPAAPPKTGVYGLAPAGRGGQFSGGKAQLRLIPSKATTHPTSGALGDLFLDKNKRLWFCKGGTTWTQIA